MDNMNLVIPSNQYGFEVHMKECLLSFQWKLSNRVFVEIHNKKLHL